MTAEERPRRKSGRPSFIPTGQQREQVRMLAGMGIPQRDIASLLTISHMTLAKNFRQELRVGGIQATAKVAQSLFRLATGANPNVAACIFWLKTRARWSERAEIDIVNTDGSLRPTIIEVVAGKIERERDQSE